MRPRIERASGYLLIGKLAARTMEDAARRTIARVRKHLAKLQTIPADDGTELPSYKHVEAAPGVPSYLAVPHHA